MTALTHQPATGIGRRVTARSRAGRVAPTRAAAAATAALASTCATAAPPRRAADAAAAEAPKPPARRGYAPISRAERTVMAVLAGIACATLLGSVLWLFHTPNAQWAGMAATPAGPAPSCIATDPTGPGCERRVGQLDRIELTPIAG